MEIVSFYGKTPTVALENAKDKLGENALVIKTQLIHKKTPTKEALYKVDILSENLNSKESEITTIKKEISLISKNINQLKDELKSVKQRDCESVEPKNKMYEEFKDTKINTDILNEILNDSMEHIPQEIKKSPKKLKEFFYKLLAKLIKSKNELEFRGKKIMMLVGPTGVGKTTTIAKISAIASIVEYNYSVGIITLDNYRVGAIEQLNSYAKIMNLPIKSVDSVKKFRQALEILKDKDLILIDTAGSSPKDSKKINKIYEYLQNSKQNITINLVLSSNTKYDDQLFAYEKFSSLVIDALIFTKLDETSDFGNIYSLIYKLQKPVSYFCVGQEVPDDIVFAEGEFLIKCLTKGLDESS